MRRLFEFVGATLLVTGMVLAFKGPLSAMMTQWSVNPMYAHAYIVPFISLLLIWTHRHRFEPSAKPARLAALPILVGALLMLVLGEVAALQVVQQVAFIVVIAGVVLFLFGFSYLKTSTPAIAYLLFMVPFWDVFTEPLHEPFQHNSARLGIALMHTVGVPAYREGTVIALPNAVIEVARACSGVNYLIGVLALAVPLVFIRLETKWRRVLLVASAMVISALANGLRVALIGVLAYLDIGSPLHGPFHVLHGLFVAGIGYIALFVGLSFLENGERSRMKRAVTSGPERGRARLSNPIDLCGLASVFWVLVFVGLAPASVPVALATSLHLLPAELGAWRSEPALTDPPTDAWTQAHDHFRREFRSQTGTMAVVDVWYFAEQRQNREVVNYKVASLHRRAKARRIALGNDETLTVNTIEWPEHNEVGLFWYELGGAAESHEYLAKLRSVWSTLRSGRSNAAAVMITSHQSALRGEARLPPLDDLAAEIHKTLSQHWPSSGTDSVAARTN
jgi:EpsI family protein